MQMQCNRISRIWICFRMKSMLHYKARDELYIGSKDVRRFPVPDDKVTWSTAWPEYKPVDYTAPPVLNRPVWADPDFRFALWRVFLQRYLSCCGLSSYMAAHCLVSETLALCCVFCYMLYVAPPL